MGFIVIFLLSVIVVVRTLITCVHQSWDVLWRWSSSSLTCLWRLPQTDMSYLHCHSKPLVHTAMLWQACIHKRQYQFGSRIWNKVEKKSTPHHLYHQRSNLFFIVLLRRNPSLLSREHNTVMKNLEKGSHSTRLWAKVNWLHFFFSFLFFEKIEIRHFLFIFRQHDASIKVFIYPAAVLTEAQSCKA